MKKRPGLAQNKMILWLFRFFFNFGPCLFISSKWKFRPKKYRSTIEKNFFNFSIFDAGGASIPRTRLSSRLTSFFHAARRRRRRSRVGVRSVIARLLISLFIKKWASSWLFYSLFSFFSLPNNKYSIMFNYTNEKVFIFVLFKLILLFLQQYM